MGRLSALGSVAKNGASIEKLAAVDTVVFDKTGTLTLSGEYEPELSLLASSVVSREVLCGLISVAESGVEHPIASALRGLSNVDADWQAVRIRILPGAGIRARVRDLRTQDRFDVQIGIASALVPELADPADECHRVAVLVDGIPSALIRLHEKSLPGVARAIRVLEQAGIECMLMTGDSEARASSIPFAVRHVRLTPDDKLALCRSVSDRGTIVTFVGDGLNDAAAMSVSVGAVSIAASTGARLALEVADFVWTEADLGALPVAIETCRRTVRSMRFTIWIALGYNVCGVALAAAGALHPVVASLLMTCSSCVVTWRSVRLLDRELA